MKILNSGRMKEKDVYKPNSSDRLFYTRSKKGKSHIINKGEEKLKEWKPKGPAHLKAEAHSTNFPQSQTQTVGGSDSFTSQKPQLVLSEHANFVD